MKALIVNKLRTFLNFKYEIINILAGDIANIIFNVIFWKIILERGFFGISPPIGFLFLSYKYIVLSFFVFVRGSQDNVFRSISRGKLNAALMLPTDFLIYTTIRYGWIPLGPILNSIVYFFVALQLGLCITKYVIIGYLLAIFSGIFISIVMIIINLSYFFFESGIFREFERLPRKLSLYPTHVYSGISFLIANVLIPSFAYGTYSLLIVSNRISLGSIIFYQTVYLSFGTFIGLFLIKYLKRKALERYCAYG